MGIAVLITAALLPIMAWLGVFKAVKQKYYAVTMVNLPAPKPLPKAAQPHHKKVASKSHSESHSNERKQEAKSTKPLPFHVAAAASTGGNSGGPSVVNGTNTNIGTVPTAPPAPAPTQQAPAPATAPPPAPTPAPKPQAQVATAPPPAPAPAPVDAQVVYDPKPSIPSDLLGSDLNTDFWALFTIHADGTTDVKMLQSTGNEELDQIAMQSAKEWKFKPATVDGKPVDSYERLDVQFQVS